MKFIEKVLFIFGYIKIQRPTQFIPERMKKCDIQKVSVTAEFPIGEYKFEVIRRMIPKLGEAMLPYVEEESYFNKEQKISRFTWTIKINL